ISGAGGVRKNGDGTLTFTAIQTYDGETEITDGALQTTTERLAGDVDVAGGAALFFNQATDGSYGGVISGAGSLAKTGTGAVTLTGRPPCPGGAFVNVGALLVSGSLAGRATVGSDGLLGGNGRFLGGILNNGALAPGNSIGTMHVSGPLTFGAGSAYAVEV